MISTRSVGLLIDTVVCLTLAKWETVSGRFGGYLTLSGPNRRRCVNCFTPRIIVILMETIEDLYISAGQVPLDGTLGRDSRWRTNPLNRARQGGVRQTPPISG